MLPGLHPPLPGFGEPPVDPSPVSDALARAAAVLAGSGEAPPAPRGDTRLTPRRPDLPRRTPTGQTPTVVVDPELAALAESLSPTRPAPPPPPSPSSPSGNGAHAPAPPHRELPPLPPPDPPAEPRRWPLAAAAVAVVVVLAGVLVVLVGGGSPDDEATGGADTTTAERSERTTSTVDPASLGPADALGHAADLVEEAGRFTYTGTSLAVDVNRIRPGMWLTVELATSGEVDLDAPYFHEVGQTADGRVNETVADGTQVWGRLADTPAGLADVGYLTIGEPSATRQDVGQLLVPTWLTSATAAEDLPPTDTGLRVVRAVVPAAVVGEVSTGQPPVDAELIVVLGVEGEPLRVELRTLGGPQLAITMDLVLGGTFPVAVPESPSDDDVEPSSSEDSTSSGDPSSGDDDTTVTTEGGPDGGT